MKTERTLQAITEQNLIDELKQDSVKAFEKIYNIYAKQLYAFCLQYTKINEDAEDTVEEVFIRLWEYRKQIKKEDTLRPLLFIMAKNSLINAYRSRVNSPTFEDYADYENVISENQTSGSIEYEEFLLLFNNALKKLPPAQQRIITLSKLESLSNKEIAIKLKLSEQTVKNQLSTGLKALKKELAIKIIIPFLLFFVN